MPKIRKNSETKTSTGEARTWQTWLDGGHCPKGTIPIRRSSIDDVLRAKSLFDYGKKQPRRIPLAKFAEPPDVVSGNGHEVISLL